MTSPSPLLYNTYYHIFNRGVNGEDVFIEERNYEHFLNLFAKHIEPVCDLFGYCMLRNHFHMGVRVKSEEEIVEYLETLEKETLRVPLAGKPLGSDRLESDGLGSQFVSDQFSNFFNAYAKAINRSYGRTGSLFQHPFGRVPITSDRQFWNVIAYIHQNPQKHKFVEDFRDWKYSSYGIILTDKKTSVNRTEVLKWFGSPEQYLELHKDWVDDTRSKWFAEEDYD
jgi:putative transposase